MKSSRKSYANMDVERKVLSHFVRVDFAIPLRLDYFTSDEARRLFRFIQKQRKTASNAEELWELWSVELQRTIAHEKIPEYEQFLQSLWLEDDLPEDKLDYYLEQLRGFAEARDLYEFMDKSISFYKEGNVTEAREALESGLIKIKQDFPMEVVSRGDFLDGFQDRYDNYKKRKKGEVIARIPTGIAKIDRKIIGTPRSTLNFIQGAAGTGKTFILQEIGFQNLLNAYKILFVTVEMQKDEIDARWDSRVGGFDAEKFSLGELTPTQEKWWIKQVSELKKAYDKGGRLATAFIPEGCTTLSLEAELQYWKREWNSDVDIIIIDYADLMSSARKTFSDEDRLGSIFKDLKRFSQIHKIVVWTASQLSGTGYGKSTITTKDTGYSKKKNHWANLILGIGNSIEDVQSGILKIYVGKNTFGKSHFEVVMYSDFSQGRIDVERERTGNKEHDQKEDVIIQNVRKKIKKESTQ